jgi:hypothetical protein
MQLRDVLGQLVTLALAAGCHHGSRVDNRPIGGGCPPDDASVTVKAADVDDKLRAELDACVDEKSCEPVCRDLLDRRGTSYDYVHCNVLKDDGESAGGAQVRMSFGHACAGRLPSNLDAPSAVCPDPVAWITEQARLEAASVIAFRELAVELVVHGAPSHLIDACLVAATEEERHARLCGGQLLAPRERQPIRSIEELAIDNAVEGEVRETWGAVLAAYQAQAAHERSLRELMASIAPDELSHAELSAELGRWYASQLSPEANARVAMAKRAAIAALASALDEKPASTELVETVGLPSVAASAELFAGLLRTVWAA